MPSSLASAAAPRALGTRFSLGENGDIAGARLIRSVKLLSLAVGNQDVNGAVQRVVKMVRARAKAELERWGRRGAEALRSQASLVGLDALGDPGMKRASSVASDRGKTMESGGAAASAALQV